MLLAAFLFTLMATFVKLLAGIPPLEVIFFRAIISIALCVWGLQRAGVPFLGTHRLLLSMRGIVGAVSLTMNFWLVQQIPLATSQTLLYLAPLCTTLLGVFILRQGISAVQWLFFLLSFAGVVVVQGFDARISMSHLLLGVASSFVMGLAYNLVSKLSTLEHPLVIIFYFPLMCLPIAGIATWLQWVQPLGWQWFHLFMVGITAQMAQYYMTLSYRKAAVGTVSIVNYTSIIYSLIIGYILFNEHFNAMTYVGMALVLAGVILNVLWKQGKKLFSVKRLS